MHLNRRYTYLDIHVPEMVENYVGAVDKVQITQVYADVQSTEYIFFTRDETGLVYLPTQLERTLKLYW